MVVSSLELTAEPLLLGHIEAMSETYSVVLVGNCQDGNRLRRKGINADVIYVPIVREISPLRDLIALSDLIALFKKRKFAIVHSVSPKAGLLAMLAAWLSCVPVRIHTFTGQVWATRKGFVRTLLKSMDRLLSACATNILVDSRAQMEYLLRHKVIDGGKASVLADGSLKGVDINRFQPRQEVREALRAKLAIPQEAIVFIFVGRLKRDKGVLDLAMAFSRVCQMRLDAYLIVVGVDEENLKPQIESRCNDCLERMLIVGPSSTPEDFITCADILCLPSYREGFSNVVLEAAACEVPTLASKIYGTVDTIHDGVTGMFHAAGDVDDLVAGMLELAQNPAKRIEMGQRARARAVAAYSSERVTAELLNYYAQELLPG